MYYLGDKLNEVQFSAAGNADGNGMFSERVSFFFCLFAKSNAKSISTMLHCEHGN